MPALKDFDYSLPKELIAAYPPKERAGARLLRVDRRTGEYSHHTFRDILQFFEPGDLLVLNNTKVLPARIFGKKETGGKVEALLLKEKEDGVWEALLRPGGRIRKGATLNFGENGFTPHPTPLPLRGRGQAARRASLARGQGEGDVRLQAEVLEDFSPKSRVRLLRFENTNVRGVLEKIGHIPLPPYLGRPDSEIDRERYQTVFAEKPGAAASPTAGLHFDKKLLDELERKGIEIVCVTLHVSYGTFQTIAEEDLSRHQMFEEEFEVVPEAAGKINRAKQQGRRVVACGTTTVRALESAAEGEGVVRPQHSATRLFIYPPYEFKIVDGLITNFHLPKSSLLMLAAAFVGRDPLRRAYEEAIRERYSFYSYGDAMVIL